MLRTTVILFVSVMLNGCQISPIKSNGLADYRATVISNQLPQELGSIILVNAQSEGNSVTLGFVKKKTLNMDRLVEKVAVSFGYLFSRFLGLNPQKSRTVSLETGIQNGPLAALVVSLTFVGEMQQQILLIPVMYSLFIVINSTVITFFYRKQTFSEELARDQAKIEPTNNSSK